MVALVYVPDVLGRRRRRGRHRAKRVVGPCARDAEAGCFYDPAPVSYVQANQPEGVPPLSLTGERTLPDVPEENYWYRRHLAVYEWIAERTRGLRVADLACGEGYGSDVLAKTAAQRGRSRRQSRGVRARAASLYALATCASSAVSSRTSTSRATRSSSSRRSSTSTTKRALLTRIAKTAPCAYISTPNRLTLAPEGAEKSENPWHLREYTAAEYSRAPGATLLRGTASRALPCAKAPRA